MEHPCSSLRSKQTQGACLLPFEKFLYSKSGGVRQVTPKKENAGCQELYYWMHLSRAC
jgi:hypothetical protein